jgi:hypothetical protein
MDGNIVLHNSPSQESFTTWLPHMTFSSWQKKVYQKDTKFYGGWTFIYGSIFFVAGWNPNLKIIFGWGYLPNSGHGWVEPSIESFEFVYTNQKCLPWTDVFKDGGKTVDELNKLLPSDKQINCNKSFMTLPNGQKIWI